MEDNGLTGFEMAIKGALDDLGLGLLSRPREFVGMVSDFYDPESPEVTVLYLHAADGLLKPYAEAAGRRDVDALAMAGSRAELWLRDVRLVEADVAHTAAWGIARGVAAHLGILVDVGTRQVVDGARAVLADGGAMEKEVAESLDEPRALPAGIPDVYAFAMGLKRRLGLLVEKRTVEEYGHREEQEQLQSQQESELIAGVRWTRKHYALVAILAVCLLVVVALAVVGRVRTSKDFEDYSWSELKDISDEISAAQSDDEGLEVAQQYNLVDSDGELWGETKAITLGDGSEAHVRILGFRHDDLAGGGKAGITFEFADVPAEHRVNAGEANSGGWEASEMREWLNSEFLMLLPDDLRSCVLPVAKCTNNVGEVKQEGDLSVVTVTTDSLWLLSAGEVYGDVPSDSYSAETYDFEGTQYKLYTDNGVSTSNYDFCQKRGVRSQWWLRSPSASYLSNFHGVHDDGEWYGYSADYSSGVSPGFCI